MTGYKGMGMRAQLFKLFEGPGVPRNSKAISNFWPAPTLNIRKGSLQSAAVLVFGENTVFTFVFVYLLYSPCTVTKYPGISYDSPST